VEMTHGSRTGRTLIPVHGPSIRANEGRLWGIKFRPHPLLRRLPKLWAMSNRFVALINKLEAEFR